MGLQSRTQSGDEASELSGIGGFKRLPIDIHSVIPSSGNETHQVAHKARKVSRGRCPPKTCLTICATDANQHAFACSMRPGEQVGAPSSRDAVCRGVKRAIRVRHERKVDDVGERIKVDGRGRQVGLTIARIVGGRPKPPATRDGAKRRERQQKPQAPRARSAPGRSPLGARVVVSMRAREHFRNKAGAGSRSARARN